jgi:hypothetical protein
LRIGSRSSSSSRPLDNDSSSCYRAFLRSMSRTLQRGQPSLRLSSSGSSAPSSICHSQIAATAAPRIANTGSRAGQCARTAGLPNTKKKAGVSIAPMMAWRIVLRRVALGFVLSSNPIEKPSVNECRRTRQATLQCVRSLCRGIWLDSRQRPSLTRESGKTLGGAIIQPCGAGQIGPRPKTSSAKRASGPASGHCIVNLSAAAGSHLFLRSGCQSCQLLW